MRFLAKKAIVGLVALVTSIIPVAEIGLFGYETFIEKQDQQTATQTIVDEHTQAFERLMAFEGRIRLHAEEARMEDDPAQQEVLEGRVGNATRLWLGAESWWQDRNHTRMDEFLHEAGEALAGRESMAPQYPAGSVIINDVLDPGSRSFRLLLVAGTGVLALLSWFLFLGLGTRDQDTTPRPTTLSPPGPTPRSPPRPPPRPPGRPPRR